MRNSAKAMTAGFLGLTAVIVSTSAVSAAIVCNREGACWHVHQAYAYPPGYGIVVHPNHWAWGPNEHYYWREHPGRGYWRGGVWVTF